MLNIAVYQIYEGKTKNEGAHTKVRSIAGLNNATVRLRSGFVVQPRTPRQRLRN